MARGRGLGGAPKSFTFEFNGGAVEAVEGDSVASALVRAGVWTFSRSMKFHRPRGFYCGAGRCFSCAMRVNGVPAVRTCSVPVAPGMVVQSQGGWPSTRFDIMSLMDAVFRRQLDYHSRFLRPKFMTPLYQYVVRRLATSSALPDSHAGQGPMIRTRCDALLIGHGVSGSVARSVVEKDGWDLICVDSRPRGGCVKGFAFGFYEDGSVGVQAGSEGMLVSPKAVLVATGRSETSVPLVNGDLPGVLLPSALAHLADANVSPGRLCAIIGDNELRAEVERSVQRLGMAVARGCPDLEKVVRVLGRKRAAGIEIASGDGSKERSRCDVVVVLGPLVPSVELAQQAGCDLGVSSGFWHVRVDPGGRTSVPGVFASGGSAGFYTDQARKVSGAAAGKSISSFLEGSRRP